MNELRQIEKLIERISSNQQSAPAESLAVTETPPPATVEEIALIVHQTLVVKQLVGRIGAQELDALIVKLFQLQYPLVRICAMSESVMAQQTYGTIAFEYWVSDLVVSLREQTRELRRAVEEEITRRREAYLEAGNTEEEARRLGYGDHLLIMRERLMSRRAEIARQIRRDAVELAAQYRVAPEIVLRRFIEHLISNKFLDTPEDYIDRLLEFYISFEFETAKKILTESKKQGGK